MDRPAKYKILIVDDEKDIREILIDLLSGEGFECTTASDGKEASEILGRKPFDLLITDFRMPHMDGPELLNWCRNNDIHFPVIFVTGNLELLPKEKVALKDCCAGILRKPLAFNELLIAIDDARNRNHHRECQ